MAKHQFSKFNSFQLLSPILIILYLNIGFIPNLEAVDKIAPQWVGMTLINLLSISTIFYYRKELTNSIYFSLSSMISITYILLSEDFVDIETKQKIRLLISVSCFLFKIHL